MHKPTAKPKVMLTGVHGQLGEALQRHLREVAEVTSLDRQVCDLSDAEAIRVWVQKIKPDYIVNPAAYTAVDKAETERDTAYAVNATAPQVMAEEVKKLGAYLIHYSTDYVFDGNKQGWYDESDATHPQSVYGASKLAGEQAIAATGVAHTIFRTSWVVGQHGGNFAKTILRLAKERPTLKVVADQWGAPTSAELIAEVTVQAIKQLEALKQQGKSTESLQGVFHLAAAGETTWHAYAQHVAAQAREAGITLALKPEDILPIPSSEYPLPAPRPTNSRLSTQKLHDTFGISVPAWQNALAPVLKNILQA